MLFGRVRLCTTLLSLLLVFSRFFGISGLALAQSLLSDRVWLEQNKNILIEKDLTEQNNHSRVPPGMIHAPLSPHHSFSRRFAPEEPKLLYPTEFPPRTSLLEMQKNDLINESPISHSSMNFQVSVYLWLKLKK